MKRTLAILLAFAVMGGSLLFATGQKEAAAPSAIRIGASVSLTGNLSRFGNLVKNGYELWKEKVNARGGIDVGGKMLPVEIVYYDDQSDNQTAAKLTEKLITEDKVQFLLGPYGSGPTFATTAIAEKYDLITMACLANATNIYERGFQNVYSVLAPGTWVFYSLIDMLAAQNPRPTKVAIIYPNDNFPATVAKGADEYAKSKGFEVVYIEEYPKGVRDLSSTILKIKNSGAEVLMGSGYLEEAILTVRQLKEQRVSLKAVGFTTGPEVLDFRTNLGEDANGVYGVSWWMPQMAYTDPLFGSASQYAKPTTPRSSARGSPTRPPAPPRPGCCCSWPSRRPAPWRRRRCGRRCAPTPAPPSGARPSGTRPARTWPAPRSPSRSRTARSRPSGRRRPPRPRPSTPPGKRAFRERGGEPARAPLFCAKPGRKAWPCRPAAGTASFPRLPTGRRPAIMTITSMSVLTKSRAILELIQKHNRDGLTNREISLALGLPPPSCHRLLRALEGADFVRRAGPGRRWTLGYAHLRFADTVLESMDEAAVCLPYLEQLHLATEETTFYARFCDTACVTMQICGPINRGVSIGRGEIMPLSCTAAGQAALAFLPERRKQALLRGLELPARTPNSITDPRELRRRLREVRRRGVALNFEEMHSGVNAVAGPIFAADGARADGARAEQGRDSGGLLGALVIVGPSVDLDEGQMLEYRLPLLAACAEVSETLGGTFPAELLAGPAGG